MQHDLYNEVERVAVLIEKDGESELASALRDAVSAGATGSEICFALRFQLGRALEGPPELSARTVAEVRELCASVERALSDLR